MLFECFADIDHITVQNYVSQLLKRFKYNGSVKNLSMEVWNDFSLFCFRIQ